ncbi:MAG: Peptidase [Firmicutes bacterium]|nr:Peptidase [Bacillota bacterium]
MAKQWNNWGRNQHWDNKDGWQQYGEEEYDYGWLKKTVIALIVFAIAYGANVSETTVGKGVTDGLKYVLTTPTDFDYIGEVLEKYLPQDMDVAVIKRIRETMAKPADPLLYMAKPVDGKLVKMFGWYTDPATKEEKLSDGITIAAVPGTLVKAAASGKVKAVAESAQYGRILIIEHSHDVDTVYGKLDDILVKPDEQVSQGQVVASVGKSANLEVSELYFEIRDKGKAIDPLTRIKNDTSH